MDFSKESEMALVSVWIMLPSLLPNYYHEAFLKSIMMLIGVYLRRDNATRCARGLMVLGFMY